MDHHRYSPSRLPRIALCPGSVDLCEEAERQGLSVESGADAARGTSLHEAMASGEESDSAAVAKAREYSEAKTRGISDIRREQTVVLWGTAGVPLTWGTVDFLAIDRPRAVLIDYKFGFNPPSRFSCDLQLRTYAGAVMQEYELERVDAFVYFPNLDEDLVGVYTRPDLIVERVRQIIEYSVMLSDTRKPSPDACRYCAARTICQEFQQSALALLPTTQEQLQVLDPSRVSRLLEFAQLIAPWAESVRKKARELMEGGLQIPGWELKERRLRKANPVELSNEIQDLLSIHEFIQCCDVKIASLEDLYARRWKELNQDGATIVEGKKRFAQKQGIESVVSKYLKRKE